MVVENGFHIKVIENHKLLWIYWIVKWVVNDYNFKETSRGVKHGYELYPWNIKHEKKLTL